MIRLAVRVASDSAEIVLAELLELVPGGVEELELAPDLIEYAVYGAPGELPTVPELNALAGEALVRVSSSEVPDGWEHRWRRFHRPVVVSAGQPSAAAPHRIRVRPPWEAPLAAGDPDRETVEIVIDPGRAFGTGGHPTTQLCLELLLELLAGGVPRGELHDIGTGSGVIAIAAAKLGFAPVLALDNDAASLEAAAANAAVNHVAVEVRRFDLRSDPPPAPAPARTQQRSGRVVCANLLLPLLLELSGALRTAPARLIAGGLLRAEADLASEAFAARLGMRELSRRERGDWAALSLAGAQPPSGSSVAARTIAR